ncbi:MAG: cation:proton antiporter, partial [Candidatus Thalassarchaeaceae archaeon]|jgi:CPA1 family monovalent cation:H+ antiporter|nr:cation:proton antiporter [Candidatus Thalassarchaeaceae archaeon]
MSAIPPTWLEPLLGTLILALLVAIAIRWVRLPYTIALVIVGLILGWLGESMFSGIEPDGGLLSAELILFILLPPLLFEGSSAMHIDRLKSNWRTISLLAIPGVLINTLVIALICWRLIWWGEEHGFLYGLLIGSILAATDPVSVLALVRNLGAPKRLSVLLEGESLFNDGTAIVLFNIILLTTLSIIAGESIGLGQVLTDGIASFIVVVTVGVVVGYLCGMVANHLLHQSEDHLVEIALTVALAFGSFLLAELMHGSGVISVVVAGLLVGNKGVPEGMTPTARVGLHHFWEVVSFLVNSILFLVVGYELQSVIAWDMHTGFLALVAIMAALFARLAVFPLTDIANIGGVNKIDRKWQLAMWWGGLRGSIPIALLLLLSHIVHEGQALLIGGNTVNIKLDDAIYSDMLILAFSVILFTLLVQGLTMKSLLDRLGIGGRLAESEARYESALAHLVASRAALRKLSSLSTHGLISEVDRERLAEPYHVSIEKSKSRIFELSETSLVHAGRIESARRDLIRVQIEALRDAERLGQLNPHVIEKTLQALDAALSISEFAHEEIVVVTDEAEIDPYLDIERDSEELIPESTESIVSDASTDSESE